MPLIRCTRPDCSALQEVVERELGRNVVCSSCGALITAVPSAVHAPREASPPLPFAVILDDIRSLWNVGSMFRTADAAGVSHLHLCGITGFPPRKEIAKTALGAEDAVDWSHDDNAVAVATRRRDDGDLLVALELTERSRPYHELELAVDRPTGGLRPICLVIGNEVAGVAPALLELAPLHMSLPMVGVKESLNAAVAFGIAAYEIARQMRARDATEMASRGGATS